MKLTTAVFNNCLKIFIIPDLLLLGQACATHGQKKKNGAIFPSQFAAHHCQASKDDALLLGSQCTTENAANLQNPLPADHMRMKERHGSQM